MQHFNSLVAMYEAMRPKDAARIFDRLEINILVEVATKMKARSMSAIMAQMTPEAAERLTVELANRASADAGAMTKPRQTAQNSKQFGRPLTETVKTTLNALA